MSLFFLTKPALNIYCFFIDMYCFSSKYMLLTIWESVDFVRLWGSWLHCIFVKNWLSYFLKLPRIRSCKKEIQNVLFLKTHYTGSDVVTNILNRFADLRGLRIALPSGGLSTFYWPSRFHWKYVDIMLLDGSLPNILCNHARFNGEVMDEIMQPQTAFITILRDPISHFEVTFHNLNFAEILEMEDLPHPYLTFLENPGKYIGRAIHRKRFKVW